MVMVVNIKRGLEFLAAGGLFLLVSFGPLVGFLVAGYLLVFSAYRFYTLLYVVWIWYDLKTCERGGRRVKWVRRLSWWSYAKDYYPLVFETADGVSLNPSRNYIICGFPHGIYPMSAFTALISDGGGFERYFPNFSVYGVTLKVNFISPFYREFAYAVGLCCASAKSLKWILSRKEGGNAALIAVGGAAEAIYSKPGQYNIVIKNRKGFVKLALQTGSPLVPMLSFGESDLFDQYDNPKGSRLRAFQEWIKKYMGYAPVIVKGRGIFQESFGILPRRRPVTTLVGPPLEVTKIENPSYEEICKVHQQFMNHLDTFFEQHKHKYVDNADKVRLVMI